MDSLVEDEGRRGLANTGQEGYGAVDHRLGCCSTPFRSGQCADGSGQCAEQVRSYSKDNDQGEYGLGSVDA